MAFVIAMLSLLPHLNAQYTQSTVLPTRASDSLNSQSLKTTKSSILPTHAPETGEPNKLLLKTNILPWLGTIPNLGVECSMGEKWSLGVDAWFCPWKISNQYSVKTVAILPEVKYWFKNNIRGSYINLHLSVAWFNVRWKDIRYQDDKRPLLGAGIGYGYRYLISDRWGMEFELGAGFASIQYSRFYNTGNGAQIDTRKSLYLGLDRLGISFIYFLKD